MLTLWVPPTRQFICGVTIERLDSQLCRVLVLQWCYYPSKHHTLSRLGRFPRAAAWCFSSSLGQDRESVHSFPQRHLGQDDDGSLARSISQQCYSQACFLSQVADSKNGCETYQPVGNPFSSFGDSFSGRNDWLGQRDITAKWYRDNIPGYGLVWATRISFRPRTSLVEGQTRRS